MSRQDASANPSPARRARAVELGLFFAGTSLGTVFLVSILPAFTVPLAAGALTAAYALRGLARDPARGRRAAGIVGWIVTGSWYLFSTYLGVAFGSVLFWSLHLWGWGLLVGAAAAVAATLRRPWRGVRVPTALPLGLWTTLCLAGWRTEEQVVRCNDYLALGQEQGVEVVVSTMDALSGCTQGASVRIGRYPRFVWQPSAGGPLFVTTQRATGADQPTQARFKGSVCVLGKASATECIGDGTAQRIVESTTLDRIFVPTWGRFEPGTRGRLLALPRDGRLQVLETLTTDTSLAETFYDPGADRLYGMTDEGGEIIPIVASSLKRLEPVKLAMAGPGAVRYDASRGEGVICIGGGPLLELDGSRYMVIAVRGNPLSVRALGSRSLLTRVAMTWGCDWDPASRRVFVAIPNLGLLATLDYDSGELVRTDFVGFAMRAVTFDAPRNRVYLTSFLGGEVIAVDLASGSVATRWRVGRFPRSVTLSRDGSSLYVGTNLGVIAIRP